MSGKKLSSESYKRQGLAYYFCREMKISCGFGLPELNSRKLLYLLLVLGFLPSFANPELEEHIQTLELSYIAWGCECANWAKSTDIHTLQDSADRLASSCIYIEPANSSLQLPDTIGYQGDVVRFTGQFYRDMGFPKGFSSEQMPEKSRVFRYTGFQIIKSQHAAFQLIEKGNY